MLTQAEILEAAKAVLNGLFPDVDVYYTDSQTAFLPCFALKLIKTTQEHKADINFNICTLYITFFTQKLTEDEATLLYDVKDKVIGAFWQGLKVKDRFLHFEEITADTYGKEADIVEISLPFRYYDSVDKPKDEYLIEHIQHKENNNGGIKLKGV